MLTAVTPTAARAAAEAIPVGALLRARGTSRRLLVERVDDGYAYARTQNGRGKQLQPIPLGLLSGPCASFEILTAA